VVDRPAGQGSARRAVLPFYLDPEFAPWAPRRQQAGWAAGCCGLSSTRVARLIIQMWTGLAISGLGGLGNRRRVLRQIVLRGTSRLSFQTAACRRGPDCTRCFFFFFFAARMQQGTRPALFRRQAFCFGLGELDDLHAFSARRGGRDQRGAGPKPAKPVTPRQRKLCSGRRAAPLRALRLHRAGRREGLVREPRAFDYN